VAHDSLWKLKQKERLRKGLGKKLKAFGNIAGSIGKLARAAGSVGVPAGELIGAALERSGSAVSEF
jgi:hypothetical protein